MDNKDEKPPVAERWSLWLALLAYTAFLFIYLFSSNIPYIQVRPDASAWGQFGDYVGSVINPVVGLITIWLLTVSIGQSRKELVASRRALEGAEASQKATESALLKQIDYVSMEYNRKQLESALDQVLARIESIMTRSVYVPFPGNHAPVDSIRDAIELQHFADINGLANHIQYVRVLAGNEALNLALDDLQIATFRLVHLTGDTMKLTLINSMSDYLMFRARNVVREGVKIGALPQDVADRHEQCLFECYKPAS